MIFDWKLFVEKYDVYLNDIKQENINDEYAIDEEINLK